MRFDFVGTDLLQPIGGLAVLLALVMNLAQFVFGMGEAGVQARGLQEKFLALLRGLSP